MKHKFLLSTRRNILKKFKYQKYFHCFIVCILVSYAFWFSYQQNIVTILISAAFRVAALIRGDALILMWVSKSAELTRGRCLFDARRLLEEIWSTNLFKKPVQLIRLWPTGESLGLYTKCWLFKPHRVVGCNFICKRFCKPSLNDCFLVHTLIFINFKEFYEIFTNSCFLVYSSSFIKLS